MNRLNEIEARANAATEGPWEHEPPPGPGEDPMRPICVYPKEDGGTLAYVQPLEADAEFIAAARTDVPALLDALEKVLELHQPVTDGMGFTEDGYGGISPACSSCGTSDEYAVPYPCPTVTAITTALEATK